MRVRKSDYLGGLPRITPTEWRFMNAVTRAWSLREVSRISGLSVSTVHRVLKRFYAKGRIYFMVDYKRLNLLPLCAIFPRLDVNEMPPFTVAVRTLYNFGEYTLVTALVPPPFVDKYLASFDKEPIVVVRGYERLSWRPDGGLTKYSPEKELLEPVFDFEGARKRFMYPVEKWEGSLKAPDIYDLVLLQGRLKNAFARPVKIYREARKRTPELPPASEQVLSYHFNRHLKPIWKGNSAVVYADMKQIPMKIFYFEGRDAAVFARILCQLPGFYSAIIEGRKAMLSGQPPSSYEEAIMREAGSFDVEMPLGYFVQSSSDISKVVPYFWRFVERGRWVFREEEKVEIIRAQTHSRQI